MPPRRNPESIAYHSADNPPSDAYTDAAHPEDIHANASTGQYFRTLYTETCPTCGGPAMIAEYEARTPDRPDPVTRRQLLCKTATDRFVKGKSATGDGKGVRCAPVSLPSPAAPAPRLPITRPVTHPHTEQ